MLGRVKIIEHIDMIKAFMVKGDLFNFSVRLKSVHVRNREPRTVNSVSLHGIWERRSSRQTDKRGGSYSGRCLLSYWLTGRYVLWSKLKNWKI